MLKLHLDIQVATPLEGRLLLWAIQQKLYFLKKEGLVGTNLETGEESCDLTANEFGARLLDDQTGAKINEFIPPNSSGHKTTKKLTMSIVNM